MIILYAIPVFVLLIILESLWDQKTQKGYYRFNDAVAALSTGMLNRTMDFLVLLVNWAAYETLFNAFSFWTLPQTWWVWVLAFIVYDFFYYWSHRVDHTFTVLWNAHAVHHQGEEFNLTTALRQPFTGFVKGSLIFAPMVLMGFDPYIVASVGALNLVYQFWVHTRYVPKLGWYETWFVTPSNHRVHHGMNDKYIDKNYGGVFIVWDRLFKTFEEEDDGEPVVYGVRKPLASFNPFYANVQIYSLLLKDAWRSGSWKVFIKLLLSRTGQRPPELEAQYPSERLDLNQFTPYNPQELAGARWLIWSQLVFSMGYTVWFLLFVDATQWATAAIHFVPLGAALLSMNWLLEGRVIGAWLEASRLLYIAVLVVFGADVLWPFVAAMVYLVLASALFVGFLWSYQRIKPDMVGSIHSTVAD